MNRVSPIRSAAAAGLGLLTVLVLMSLAAPWLAPGDPFAVSGPALRAPGEHLFGTDDLGRDLFAGVVHGGRSSLRVGFVAALMGGVIGMTMGGLAGMRGGGVDRILMSAGDFVQAMPRFFLVVAVVSLFGSDFWLIVVVIGVAAWPSTARLFRAQVLNVRERDFVTAARAAGASDSAILRRHVLPSAASVIAAQLSYQVGAAILAEAGLSFLGLGDPTVVSWGALLGAGQHFLREAWWMSVFPGLAITLTVLGCNLIADAFAPSPERLYESDARMALASRRIAATASASGS